MKKKKFASVNIQHQGKMATDTGTCKLTFVTDFYRVATRCCLSDPIARIYATRRLYRDMYVLSKTSVSFVGGGRV